MDDRKQRKKSADQKQKKGKHQDNTGKRCLPRRKKITKNKKMQNNIFKTKLQAVSAFPVLDLVGAPILLPATTR